MVPRTEYIQVRITPHAKRLLKLGADADGSSLSDFIRLSALREAEAVLSEDVLMEEIEERHLTQT